MDEQNSNENGELPEETKTPVENELDNLPDKSESEEEIQADQADQEDQPDPEEHIYSSSSENPKQPDDFSGGKIVKNLIEDEMKRSYIDYAMSVIVGRALPDVRDGLKPVHRRILFAMGDLGMTFNKPFKKSARIVGEVIGKYHPHGDTAIYDSMVRMAQDFSLRNPLIDGQGNFGSIDGDRAAAMRYTEARLSKIADELLADINKDTVDFFQNFSGEFQEPEVLPAKFPNLLVNGSSGIAVGMATNIPPHNLKEVCGATIELIDNPDASVDELMQHMKGPDFPTGGIICGTLGIKHAFTYGRGKVIVRARAEIQEHKKAHRIFIDEIPYMVNKSQLLEHIASLASQKTIQGISNIKDLSDKSGMRVFIELKSDANPSVILNQLFKHSRLQTTFGIINLSIVNGVPKVLTLKDTIQHFIDYRELVVRRKTEFDLKKAKERAHILEGLIIALDDIDNVIQKIKKSKNADDAKEVLITDYSLTEPQAKAILEMRLQKLASLEQEKIRREHDDIMKIIEDLKAILASREKILDIIKYELSEIRNKYGDDRRTEISFDETTSDIEVEDLIEEADMVVTMSHSGYIKRLNVDTYKSQSRGGRGVIGSGTKDDDFLEHLFIASTHSTVLFFTDKGKVYWLKVYEIPESSRQAKGKAIINLLNLDNDENISAFIPVSQFDDSHFVVFSTKRGSVKKTELLDFSRPRKGGIRAINLREDDSLTDVVLTDGTFNLIIATKKGMAARFSESQVRPMGRTASGVRGIKLKDGDEVIGMVKAEDEKTLFTITENGFGKRTAVGEYRLIGRGGIGVKNIICSERNGCAVTIKNVDEEDELMFISQSGIIIRTAVKGISSIGRNTQGVRLMRLGAGDKVIGAAKILKEDNGDIESDKLGDSDLGKELLSDELSDETKSNLNEISNSDDTSVDESSDNSTENSGESTEPSDNSEKTSTENPSDSTQLDETN
ncbi:DNA gyrase subunit A [Candidatus Woesearchaeota archaeon]|jgi:DNA gyrase subunit A|nr:DNA gyrase subunit A [Candidatus Woesearchaeota archaeon]MBT6519379.1 DNA gyrase subunit A [Candidatus Woesearchaeota archaeon]